MRLKFLLVDVDSDLESIAETLNSQMYFESLGFGVLPINFNGYAYEATFIERNNVVDEFLKPDGSTEKINLIRYKYVNFRLIRMAGPKYLLILKDPPLALRNFIHFLKSNLPDITVEKYNFDLERFYNVLRKTDDVDNCRVKMVRASSIPIGNNSVAKVQIISDSDAYKELIRVYGREVKLDKLFFRLLSNDLYSGCTVSARGSIMFDRLEHEETFVSAFIGSLTY